MAKDKALASLPPPRPLWQVPIFLLGLGAVLAVGFARPLWHTTDADRLDHDLARLRQILAAPEKPPEAVLPLARELLERCEWSYQRIAEGHFLFGSLCLRLATDAATGNLWQEARQHLEKAESLGVQDSDQRVLVYRLGVASARTGAAPARVVEYLTRGLDVADDAAEAYALLTQAYLDLPTPNVRAALEANQKLLDLPSSSDAQLAPVRLLRGELLLQVQANAEARKVLARIGPEAAPALRARARLLLAQTLQREGAWAEAAPLWEQVLADRPRPQDKGRVRYALGLCYRKLGRWADADRHWEAALQDEGDEVQAAALRLAELRLETERRTTAPELYERALRTVARPSDYRNALIDLTEARTLLEAGRRSFSEAGEHERAYRLAGLCARLAEPPAGLIAVGEAAETWARALREEARRPSTAEAGRRAAEAALRRFQEAGATFEAVAEAVAGRSDQADWLWRAGEDYWQGRDVPRAVGVYQKFVKLVAPQERLGEAWYRLAEAQGVSGDESARIRAYEKCIEYPGPYAYEARYELARMQADRGKVDSAEEALQQNLTELRLKPDVPAYERSLYALGELLYRDGKYRAASDKLAKALEQFPGNCRATSARWCLAECYRQLAQLEEQNLNNGERKTNEVMTHYREEHQRWLLLAAEHFHMLEEVLSSREASSSLSLEDQTLLGHARFAVAECQVDLGNYGLALVLYQGLAQRYKGQVEALLALKGEYYCYLQTSQVLKAPGTLLQFRIELDSMAQAAFQGRPENETRAAFEEWLKKVREKLQALLPADNPEPK
jgi:tetratricopeptide (TPR) repeat protein